MYFPPTFFSIPPLHHITTKFPFLPIDYLDEFILFNILIIFVYEIGFYFSLSLVSQIYFYWLDYMRDDWIDLFKVYEVLY